MWVFGGYDLATQKCTNDLHTLDLSTLRWEKVEQCAKVSPRSGQYMWAWDGQLWMFGGVDASTYFNDLHVYKIDKRKWETRKTNGKKPPGREHAATFATDTKFFMFGGLGEDRSLNDLYCLSKRSNLGLVFVSWERIHASGEIPRNVHGATLCGRNERLFRLGGCHRSELFRSLYIFERRSRVWSEVLRLPDLGRGGEVEEGAGAGLEGHTMVCTDDGNLLVLGGRYGKRFESIKRLTDISFSVMSGRKTFTF